MGIFFNGYFIDQDMLWFKFMQYNKRTENIERVRDYEYEIFYKKRDGLKTISILFRIP